MLCYLAELSDTANRVQLELGVELGRFGGFGGGLGRWTRGFSPALGAAAWRFSSSLFRAAWNGSGFGRQGHAVWSDQQAAGCRGHVLGGADAEPALAVVGIGIGEGLLFPVEGRHAA